MIRIGQGGCDVDFFRGNLSAELMDLIKFINARANFGSSVHSIYTNYGLKASAVFPNARFMQEREV